MKKIIGKTYHLTILGKFMRATTHRLEWMPTNIKVIEGMGMGWYIVQNRKTTYEVTRYIIHRYYTARTKIYQ